MTPREGCSANQRPRVSRKVLRGFDPQRLLSARTDARLTRSEVARLADVSVGAVRSWEVGEVTPQVDTLASVARVLGVPIAQLVPLDDSELQLFDLRVRVGLTQPQLAAAANLPTTTLAALERGHLKMQPHHAAALAAALELPVKDVEVAYHRTRNRPPERR